MLIAAALASPAFSAPAHVASLNLCTDELVMALADPGQIVSLSYLSRNPHETPYWRQARRYASNDGSLLSVVRARPDIVFSMGGGGRDTERLAKRIGARLVAIPYMMSLSDLKAGIGTVAAALERPQAGSALTRRIAALERTAPKTAQDAIWMGGKGLSLPAAGLGADWMRLAGLKQRALQGDRVTLEQLLARPPAILLRSAYRSAQYSGDQSWLSHPLARRAGKAKTLTTDGRRWTCMGPSLVPEIERIRRAVSA
ncbi:ABC transporter substrate-binding protein [Allosphingosinicella flava]|uniref:ABC transporter substrate-binding protein n=1 Tax=Allosphingosinicella flava TaxID=2771430 RepID=A0A7T2GKU5_9SPHN|nr:ABC transporter substrate-binding protein [Sphingosinicella flava]QPQ55715.1 ABC transporter substrate-binding protein [Sphingosinicella flava]